MVSSQQQQAAAAAAASGVVAIKAAVTSAKCPTTPVQRQEGLAVQQHTTASTKPPPVPTIKVSAGSMLFESNRPKEFRRHYKMTYEAFWELCSRLQAGVIAATESMAVWKEDQEKKGLLNNHDVGVPAVDEDEMFSDENNYRYHNPKIGPHRKIPTSICLACAVRYLVGGSDPLDLFIIHEIKLSEVYEAVWYTVYAVNQLDEFGIKYPAEHEKLHKMASDLRTAIRLPFDEATTKALKTFLCPRKKPEPGLKRAPRKKR